MGVMSLITPLKCFGLGSWASMLAAAASASTKTTGTAGNRVFPFIRNRWVATFDASLFFGFDPRAQPPGLRYWLLPCISETASKRRQPLFTTTPAARHRLAPGRRATQLSVNRGPNVLIEESPTQLPWKCGQFDGRLTSKQLGKPKKGVE